MVDIGPETGGGTRDVSDQIVDGLKQSDLDSLASQNAQGDSSTSTHIDATEPLTLSGETGLKGGTKGALKEIEGTTKIAPIFKQVSGTGTNAKYEITGWATVELVDSSIRGSNTFVSVKKSFLYDKDLRPNTDLTDETDVIEGAYTSPVLAQ